MPRKPASGSRNRNPYRPIARIAVLVAVAFVVAFLCAASDSAARSRPTTGPTLPQVPPISGPSILGVPASAGEIIWEARRGLLTPGAAHPSTLVELETGYSFDTSVPNADAIVPGHLRATPLAESERGYFIVQFDGPVTAADHALIESFGGRVLGYVPDYSFLVSLSGGASKRLVAEDRVAWIGLFHPAYKISTQREMSLPGVREMVLLVFPEESLDTIRDQITTAGARVREVSDNGINKIIRADIDTGLVPEIARIKGVAWIEPYIMPRLTNNQCQWVVQTFVQNNRRIWDLGIRGEGQIINVCDSGLRTTHQQFYDPAVPINDFGNYPTHRKVIAYLKTGPDPDIVFGDSPVSGYHGTHTSCTAAGDDSYVGGTSNRDGMSINAKIHFLDAGAALTDGIIVPNDLNDCYIIPYEGNAAGGARITSNSWSAPNGGSYNTHCMTIDQFVWSHPDFLACFSVGNDGGTNTVGSPASAKNVIGVGGTMNGTNADDYYSSTSKGPTDDGRMKPTLCAPADLYSAYGANDTGYTNYQGTSMSSPALAGAAGLIRQYLTEGWYPTGGGVTANAIANPSAALLKAMGINSAEPRISGVVAPNNYIGWGRILDEDVLYFPGDDRRLALVDFTEGLLTGEYVEYQVYVASSAIPVKASLVWTDYAAHVGVGTKLVNDLNLVANDGVNTYLGNKYSSGQSITGGHADTVNVEECVRRDTPNVGIWTFRIEALNVPYGPQPYAFVVTGGLASDAGVIVLDRVKYGLGDMAIKVIDLNAGPSVSVTATSDTEASPETVNLTGSNGVYEGVIPLVGSYAVSGDGELSVDHGDEVTITYNDSNPVATLVATAEVDLTWMTITDVQVTGIGATEATITWDTSALTNGKVYYGTTPGLGSETDLSDTYNVEHSFPLTDLVPDQIYYFDVESVNRAGNVIRDDNGGLHYTFTTVRHQDVLLVVGDETFPRLAHYENAFAREGWSYAVWEGAQSAEPLVGDRTKGMASYKAIIWQTGYEQYPMFPDAARDSISKLMDLGSRLAVFSHDVGWNFCDPTSPDYNTARCQWMQEELKATWQEDPLTWDTNRGYAGDPISGGYTGGVPYEPFREGGAGDEINGVAGGGSFSYTWRNNDTTPDDVGLRWTSTFPVGNPSGSIWGGTRNQVSSNFFEWAQINADSLDDADRANILDKTLTWLVGRANPTVTLASPDGGDTYTGQFIAILWTESAAAPLSIVERELSYSNDGGNTWHLITDNPGSNSYYNWNIGAIPNGQHYRVRVVIADDGSPSLHSVDASSSDFTIDRAGGDTRGPKVIAGSIVIDPLVVVKPDPVTVTATLTDVMSGNSNIAAAEWSHGTEPAPAGYGVAMSGSFDSPTVDVSVVIDDTRVLRPDSEMLWVRGRDAAGAWGNATFVEVPVVANPAGVEDGVLPARFALYANMPNPFNPITTIRFDLPQDSKVGLLIYDVSGRLVRTLVDGAVKAGRHTAVWNGKDESGHVAGSGIYFYKLKAGGYEATKRMTLLK